MACVGMRGHLFRGGLHRHRAVVRMLKLCILDPLQPAIIFAGELFEKDEALAHAKGLLLDFFRGRQVTNIALKVCAVCLLTSR
jgi:hypothetical protein